MPALFAVPVACGNSASSAPQGADKVHDLLGLAASTSRCAVAMLITEDGAHAWRSEEPCDADSLWRERRLCAEAQEINDGQFVVADALCDSRWRSHPFVSGEPRVRFLAGTPILNIRGERLGQLVVLDYTPNSLRDEQRIALTRLARLASPLIEEPSENLVRSEARFRTLVETAPGGFVLMDAFAHALYASTAITRMLGYTPEEIIGRDLFELIHPDDRKRVTAVLAEVLATPLAKGSTEVRSLHKDGSWVWMDGIAQNFLSEPGIEAIACNLWNISARKAAEAALRDSEAKFRHIMDSNMVGIFFWDLNGAISDANDRFLQLVGYTRKEMLAGEVSWKEMTPREYDELDADRTKEIAEKGVCTPFEKEYVHKDGHRVPVLLGAACMEGSRDRGLCFVIDVSDRKRVKNELLRERNLLRTLIDHIPDYIYVKDSESRYLLNNRANLEMMGLTNPEEALGKTSRDLFPPSIAGEFESSDRALFETGQAIINQSSDTVGADGRKRRLLTTKVPLRDASGTISGLVGISRDITEQLDLEARLRQSQKMECIGQLAGGVAHDFNNILTVIQGHACLLNQEPLAESQRQAALEISEAAERAANLTRQLLAFSRRHILQPKNLDLNETLFQTSSALRRMLGEQITLNVRYAANLPPVFADPGMIDQVLLNLALNARDAMPNGGNLDIVLKAIAFDRNSVSQYHDARPGTFVQLTIADSGCGIPSEHLDRVFEPFFTTKDVGRGTGLGLATVYGIIKQHNGWIAVNSEVGRGTRFDVFLPASENPLAKEQSRRNNVRGGIETILLVEDEEPLRELIRCVLETYGYRVLDAANGHKAIEVWRQHNRKFDLLLTDIVMPEGMNGRDLADALKQEKPGLRVLFSSGYSSDIIGKDFVLSDGLNFLQKPYNPQNLAQIVRDCLDR